MQHGSIFHIPFTQMSWRGCLIPHRQKQLDHIGVERIRHQGAGIGEIVVFKSHMVVGDIECRLARERGMILERVGQLAANRMTFERAQFLVARHEILQLREIVAVERGAVLRVVTVAQLHQPGIVHLFF